MSGAPSDGAVDASFDLTPMIDVVLLLIIFFMLSSQFAETELPPVDLPGEQGEAEGQPAGESSLFIDVDREGRLSVLGHPITEDDLTAMVAGTMRTRPGGTGMDVVVRADKNAPTLHLHRIAAALGRGGLHSWRIATAPNEIPGSGR